MFQPRQVEEINPLSEISFANVSPGSVGAGATVNVAATAFTLAAPGSSSPATFTLGDQLEVFPSAAATANGIIVSAAPSAVAGTATLSFLNLTAAPITPVASSKYTIMATRLPATLVS